MVHVRPPPYKGEIYTCNFICACLYVKKSVVINMIHQCQYIIICPKTVLYNICHRFYSCLLPKTKCIWPLCIWEITIKCISKVSYLPNPWSMAAQIPPKILILWWDMKDQTTPISIHNFLLFVFFHECSLITKSLIQTVGCLPEAETSAFQNITINSWNLFSPSLFHHSTATTLH
jgi:hypothetical protein